MPSEFPTSDRIVDEAPGLYVHVPFCVRKCPYCAFASGPGLARAGEWADGIRREAALRADPSGRPFATLYVGGGTPSALPPVVLATALAWIHDGPGLAPDAERTIEVNPGDVTPDTAAAWRATGFDRASLGVQALDDPTLSFLGRRHDAATARAAFAWLRAAGFDNIGIDLIYGVPGRDEARWRDTLAAALALGPDHVSCYALTIEPDTPFAHAVAAGRMPSPDDDRVADLFLAADAVLASAGFDHYEVSNWARPGRRARHNARYWSGAPWLGLGPAAHAFDGRTRHWNAPDLDGWLAGLVPGAAPTGGSETPAPAQRALENLALGLRTSDGIAPEAVSTRAAADGTLARLLADDLLRRRDGRLVPTPRGMLVADAMARALSD